MAASTKAMGDLREPPREALNIKSTSKYYYTRSEYFRNVLVILVRVHSCCNVPGYIIVAQLEDYQYHSELARYRTSLPRVGTRPASESTAA